MNVQYHPKLSCSVDVFIEFIREPFDTLGGYGKLNGVWTGCGHRFCTSCMKRHAEARVRDGGENRVTCLHAGCPRTLTFAQLQHLLSTKSFELLTTRLTESAIPDHEKVYCPYKDCSTLSWSLLTCKAPPHPLQLNHCLQWELDLLNVIIAAVDFVWNVRCPGTETKLVLKIKGTSTMSNSCPWYGGDPTFTRVKFISYRLNFSILGYITEGKIKYIGNQPYL